MLRGTQFIFDFVWPMEVPNKRSQRGTARKPDSFVTPFGSVNEASVLGEVSWCKFTYVCRAVSHQVEEAHPVAAEVNVDLVNTSCGVSLGFRFG